MTRLDLGRVWEVLVGGGLVVVEDRSCRVAVLGHEALEVFDERGRSLQRVPQQYTWLSNRSPAGMGSGYGDSNFPAFSFPSPDRVELLFKVPPADLSRFGLVPKAKWANDSRADPRLRVGVTVHLWLPDGRMTREAAPLQQTPPPPDPAGREMVGADHLATVKPDRVEVRAARRRGRGRRDRAGRILLLPSRASEACRAAFFVGSDRRAWVIIIDVRHEVGGGSEPTAKKVILVDTATGNRRELTAGSDSRTILIDRAFAFADGFLTFEWTFDGPRFGRPPRVRHGDSPSGRRSSPRSGSTGSPTGVRRPTHRRWGLREASTRGSGTSQLRTTAG